MQLINKIYYKIQLNSRDEEPPKEEKQPKQGKKILQYSNKQDKHQDSF